MTTYYDAGNGITNIILDDTLRQRIIDAIDSVNISNPKLKLNSYDLDILDPTKLRHRISTVEDGGEEVDPNIDQIKKLNLALKKAGKSCFRTKFNTNYDSWADSAMIGERCANVRKRKAALKKDAELKKAATQAQWPDGLFEMSTEEKLLVTLKSDKFDGNEWQFGDELEAIFLFLKEFGLSAELRIYGQEGDEE